MNIGMIPTSYLESMTYAELTTWFCNYLNNVVVPAINVNKENIEEITEILNQTIGDLVNYVKFNDIATTQKTGVIKANHNGFEVLNTGVPFGTVYEYQSYLNLINETFISKGTLENVITGKDLTTKSYVDEIVGDINTALDLINGEVI